MMLWPMKFAGQTGSVRRRISPSLQHLDDQGCNIIERVLKLLSHPFLRGPSRSDTPVCRRPGDPREDLILVNGS